MQPSQRGTDINKMLRHSRTAFSTGCQQDGAIWKVGTGKRDVVPLGFSPKQLKVISAEAILAHYENYAALVKSLNEMESEDESSACDESTPALSELPGDRLALSNSVLLHECYFGNLGGNGRISRSVNRELSSAYGGLGRWQELFRTTGLWIANGVGWVVLDCNLFTGDLRTYWCGDHSRTLRVGQPLLVMDMEEHSYRLDFSSSVDRYIEAFFKCIEWDEVARRLEVARRIVAVNQSSGVSTKQAASAECQAAV